VRRFIWEQDKLWVTIDHAILNIPIRPDYSTGFYSLGL
jgi:hypothetical protein